MRSMPTPARYGPRAAAALTLALLLPLGCESSPLQTDDDHPEVNGLTIVRNGEILVRVTGATSPQGAITVAAGDSLGVAVVVFDFDERTVLLDADEYIEIDVADESIASFRHSSPRSSSGTFRGHTAGQTTFEVILRHGSPPHTDFLSGAIPLIVTAGGS